MEPIDPTRLCGVPLIAAGRFAGPLQRAIHRYKYGRRRQLAGQLSLLLEGAWARSGVHLTALAFVPLHPRRRRERGFNQAELIAAELARRLRLPLLAGLSRVRDTPAQVGLSQVERRINLNGAFTWTERLEAPRELGLVDDVCTTGATLTAAGQAVERAGGSIAAFLVLGRAQTLPAGLVTLPEQSACS